MDVSKLDYLLENSDSFKDRLSANQKKALLVSLNMMSLTSTSFNPSQDTFTALGSILFRLGIQAENDDTNTINTSNYLDILETLSQSEKIWFLQILVFISKIPGEISEFSVQNILQQGLKIGVPIDQITEIIFFNEKTIPTTKYINNRTSTLQSSLENDLNNRQKRVIIACLYLMMESKKYSNDEELEFIELIGAILGIDSTSSYFSTKIEDKEFTHDINTLDRAQKEWLLYALHTLTQIDGKIEEIESVYLGGFAREMGITRSELKTVIQKMENKSFFVKN